MQSLAKSTDDRPNLSQAIEDWVSRCRAEPEIETPEARHQKKKSAALAHIKLQHELTRKRLATILNISKPRVDRIVGELLTEGAIEEEDGCFYPVGAIAARKPLFVPFKVLKDAAIGEVNS